MSESTTLSPKFQEEVVNIYDFAISLMINSLTTILVIFWLYTTLYYIPHKLSQNVASHPSTPTSHVHVDSKSNEATTPDIVDNNDQTEIQIYQQQKQQKQSHGIQPLAKYAQNLTVSHLIITCIVYWYIGFESHTTSISHTSCMIGAINYVLIAITRIILYLYYFERARRVFIGTILETKSITHKLVISWFIIGYTLSALSATCIYFIFVCPNLGDPQYFTKYTVYAAIFPLLNSTSISLFVLFYFLYKMRSLIKIDSTKFTNTATQNIELTKYIIKRLTILTIITILATWLALFGAAINVWFMGPLDNFINNLCLILSFAFMDTYYKKLCCLCIKCCQWNK